MSQSHKVGDNLYASKGFELSFIKLKGATLLMVG